MTTKEERLQKLQRNLAFRHSGFLEAKRKKTGVSKGYGLDDTTKTDVKDFASSTSLPGESKPFNTLESNSPPEKSRSPKQVLGKAASAVGKGFSKGMAKSERAAQRIGKASKKGLYASRRMTISHRERVLAKEEYRKRKLEYRTAKYQLRQQLPNEGRNKISNIDKSRGGPLSDKQSKGLSSRISGGFFAGSSRGGALSDKRPTPIQSMGIDTIPQPPTKRINPVSGSKGFFAGIGNKKQGNKKRKGGFFA